MKCPISVSTTNQNFECTKNLLSISSMTKSHKSHTMHGKPVLNIPKSVFRLTTWLSVQEPKHDSVKVYLPN